jgi:hypothetical protein
MRAKDSNTEELRSGKLVSIGSNIFFTPWDEK